MSARVIDLRSDTVTKPTPAMRRAMAEAEVGDDVYGEDPTVQKLELRVATLLGKEAALFVPSGTMGNQISIRAQTTPGDEVILERSGHSYLYESGALAGLSFVQAHPIDGVRGILGPEAVERAIRPKPDHYARTRMIVIEQTTNGGGGTVYSVEEIEALARVAKTHDLRLHIDGARLFNAQVATSTPVDRYAAACDSVSVCLSKGLGAPVGSVIAGTRAFITAAHRLRKMFGGGMRQAGILAAAGLHALDHHVERLADDHKNLRRLTEGLGRISGLSVNPDAHPTNICYVRIVRPNVQAADVVLALKKEGVLVNPTGPSELRAVTHLDVAREDIDAAIDRFDRVMR